MTSAAYYQPWDLTEEQRARYRKISHEAREAKKRALSGNGDDPLHEINVPRLDIESLMPTQPRREATALSLFSGGGGLDLGFDRAGFQHLASYEVLQDAADTLTKARPGWDVFGGGDGDVTNVDWRQYRGEIDVLQGGPPCQPFSAAGRQRGHSDERDMFPEFVRAVDEAYPRAFIAENVPALLHSKFKGYLKRRVLAPLSRRYHVQSLVLHAEDFGVPQMRRRVVFVGFRNQRDAVRFRAPTPTHARFDSQGSVLPRVMGVRAALGLPDLGVDALAPTIRSTLGGPRNTTSITSSASAARKWAELEIWPHGVAPTRERAQVFVAKNGHFRLSVPDCALIQGFPDDWPFQGPTYMSLGQVGNAVPPPVGYAVAQAVAAALRV